VVVEIGSVQEISVDHYINFERFFFRYIKIERECGSIDVVAVGDCHRVDLHRVVQGFYLITQSGEVLFLENLLLIENEIFGVTQFYEHADIGHNLLVNKKLLVPFKKKLFSMFFSEVVTLV
jgi:hypothetical protein